MSKQQEYYKKYVEPMLLPEGKTCGDCFHIERCKFLFQCNPKNTKCDWNPSRFVPEQEKYN